MSRSVLYLLSLAILVLSSTCKRVETKSDTGVDYFPLSVGQVKIYAVDSLTYNSIGNKKDSVRNYLKEIITEQNTDSSGYTAYKAECYYTRDTSKAWVHLSYYFYKKNQYHVNLVKGGITTTSFVFPVAKGRKWNVNTYNILDPENASYSFVAKPWTIYTDCVEVFIKEDVNTVEEAINKQVYCRQKGLVYKILSEISIDNSKKNGHCIITKLIK